MTDDIVDYIESNLNRGLDIEEIKQNLLSQGHSDYDIDKAFSEINQRKEEGINKESSQ